MVSAHARVPWAARSALTECGDQPRFRRRRTRPARPRSASSLGTLGRRAPACAASARYTPSRSRPRSSSRYTVEGCRPRAAAMSSQRTPSDLIASMRARSNMLSLAAILDRSTGGCWVEQPVVMTDHSQPPVESANRDSGLDAGRRARRTALAHAGLGRLHRLNLEGQERCSLATPGGTSTRFGQ